MSSRNRWSSVKESSNAFFSEEIGFVVTPWRRRLRYDMRTKTNRFVLIGTKSIILWYDVKDKNNRLWHVCSGREAPLTIGADVWAVAA